MTAFKEYDQYDALGLSALVKSKEVTARELLEEAIRRAELFNLQLNAIIYHMYEQAHKVAASPLGEGPFAGVPFLLKDLLAAYAGVPLTSGCRALKDYLPKQDSELVKRAKDAGLNIFGKTNTPELGLKAVTEPVLYGPTRNPWDLSRTPGGSSGGAAAAVAAGIVPMAGAGDGGGSIRIPSSYCGLFGLKVSRGRNPVGPSYGEVWQGAAVQHVITRSVRDSAAMLDVTNGPAPGDPYIIKPPQRPYLEEVTRDPGKLRIGLYTANPLGGAVHPECIRAVHQTAKLLEELGHKVEEVLLPYDGKLVAKVYMTMYFGEVAAAIDELERLTGRKITADDVEPATWLLNLLGRTYTAAEFVNCRYRWNDIARSMGTFHQQYDLLLTPTAATPPLLIGETDPSQWEQRMIGLINRFGLGRLLKRTGMAMEIAEKSLEKVPYTQLANITGQPAMSVPLYWTVEDLPIGSQFVARFGEEDMLLRLAAQLEQAAPWFNKRPRLVKKQHYQYING
jgi:amidase